MSYIRLKQTEFPELSYTVPRSLNYNCIYQIQFGGPLSVDLPDGRKDFMIIHANQVTETNIHVSQNRNHFRVSPLHWLTSGQVYDVHVHDTNISVYSVRPYSQITYEIKRKNEKDVSKWVISARPDGKQPGGKEMSSRELYGLFITGVLVSPLKAAHQGEEAERKRIELHRLLSQRHGGT